MSCIAFLEANETIVNRTKVLLTEQIQAGKAIVRETGIHTIEKEAAQLVKEGAQAIIARGGMYQDLSRINIGVPIVQLAISPSDILFALNTAAKKFKKAKLILHRASIFRPEDYQGLIHIDVERYSYGGVEELEQILEKLSCEESVAVVGSGAIRELTDQKNVIPNFIDIFIQDTTIVSAYHQAERLLEQMQQEIQKANLLNSILYHIKDGVIIVDMEGVVIHFNRRSEELLQYESSEVLSKNIISLIPDYPLADCKKLKIGETKDILMTFKKNHIALSTTVFMLDQSSKQLIITVCDVTKLQKMEHDIRYMLAQKGLVAEYTFKDILTQDAAFRTVIRQAERIAGFEGAVLLYGDSGTGKELFAQSIHNASERRNGPFVAVNCAAISESLLESELFGYVGGAFTGARKEGKAGLFELAHKGTVFLDEINSMSLNLQAKILRVIEQREVMRVGSDYIIPLNVRIISASNRKLIAKVKEEAFRKDLYYRLNSFELNIPTLKERKGDIVYLFKHFLSEYSGKSVKELEIGQEFEQQLLNYQWHGNVREIKSVALRYHAFQGDNQNADILPANTPDTDELVTDNLTINLKELNKKVEDLVIHSLVDKNISKTEIARVLGISRQALYKKLNNDEM